MSQLSLYCIIPTRPKNIDSAGIQQGRTLLCSAVAFCRRAGCVTASRHGLEYNHLYLRVYTDPPRSVTLHSSGGHNHRLLSIGMYPSVMQAPPKTWNEWMIVPLQSQNPPPDHGIKWYKTLDRSQEHGTVSGFQVFQQPCCSRDKVSWLMIVPLSISCCRRIISIFARK